MPPKQKGQNVRGRDKIFSKAVEHVHIGVGHAVLGNLSLQLAAGPPPLARGVGSSDHHTTTTVADVKSGELTFQEQQQRAAALLADRPAFYTELNAQLLSHTSKDFKKFRWEVLELCETRPLFLLNRYEIARKLLDCLIQRSSGTFGNKSKAAAALKGGEDASRGETTEGFEGFARLTIAFVRDTQEKFLPFYEVFQQAVQAGLWDKNGHLIADVSRLQLVYAVQAAWCRELAPYWLPAVAPAGADAEPNSGRLVRRILSLYVAQLRDTKEYIRRLGAEWLAYLCRMCRPMVSLVVELACGDVLAGFETHAVEDARAAAQAASAEAQELLQGDDGVGIGGEDDNDDEEVEAAGATSSTAEAAAAAADDVPLEALTRDVWASARVETFVTREMPVHPVIDGMVFFAAELFRGMRGSLNTNFERFYVKLLESFLLLDDASRAQVRHQLVKKAAGADSMLVHEFFSDDDDDEDEDKNEEEARGDKKEGDDKETGSIGARTQQRAPLHAADGDLSWPGVFSASDAASVSSSAASPVEREEDGEAATIPGFTCCTSDAVCAAQLLVREVGSAAIRGALDMVLRETKKHSSRGLDSEGDDDEEEEEDGARDMTAASQDGGVRPAHRILFAVVTCLQASKAQHLRILAATLNASSYFLWADRRELPLMTAIAAKLRKAVALTRPSSKRRAAAMGASRGDDDYLHCAGAVLELVHPLCATAHLGAQEPSNARATAWLMELQKLFLPVAKECVANVAGIANGAGGEGDNTTAKAARLVLFAFAQDVLQKNFTFCLAEERRLAEAHSALYGDSDSSGDDDDAAGVRHGVRRLRANGTTADDREDAYVPEEDREGGSGRAARSSSSSSKFSTGTKGGARRSRAAVVQSFLTPLALTLLHSICHNAWSTAGHVLADGRSTSPTNTRDRRTIVDQAILLARLTMDRTRHLNSSPLQQLLRLVSQKAKQQQQQQQQAKEAATDGKTADPQQDSAGQALVVVLENLLRQLVSLASVVTAPASSKGKSQQQRAAAAATASLADSRPFRQRALDWLSLTLPLFGALATSSAAATAVAELKDGLLAILRNIKMAASSSASPAADRARTTGDLLASSTTYALYARIAVLLVNLASPATTGRRRGGSDSVTSGKKKGKKAAATQDASAANSEEQQQQQRAESLQHLAETISILARGFMDQQASCATANQGVIAQYGNGTQHRTAPLPGEESRARLFQGAELLLGALLNVLDVAGNRNSNNSGMATLHTALTPEAQRQLFEVILLESLTAPSQPLRMIALRLVQAFCHPDCPAAQRFAGAGPLDLSLCDALLAAEAYNPLSHTGNLDGLRQALAKVSFAAEAGTIADPLERVVLARAMIGLLYLKFADAWPTALKILTGLLRRERTTMLPAGTAAEGEDDGDDAEDDDDNHHDARGSRARTLEPVVWDSVICRYAHLLVFGDVLGRDEGDSTRSANAPGFSGEMADNEEEDEYADDSDDDDDVSCFYYHIRLTDFQRHQKGELVSKAFSVAQYVSGGDVAADRENGGAGDSLAMGSVSGGVVLVNMAEEDHEVLAWETHAPLLLSAAGDAQKRKSRRGAELSTDRATLAKTFLGSLEEMMKNSSSVDRKLRLVEDLVFELVAIQRNEHPGIVAARGAGGGGGPSKKLDDRLALAMKACSVAPTTILTNQDRRRLPAAVTDLLSRRNAQLIELFLSYTSDANGRLQRGAIDNLKRLKVEPFATHHAKLTPYCEPSKVLFNFLSSFHVETDIPVHEQPDYVSTALAIALPKLVANVSKEKRRDQAVLQRRMMGFLTHLADRMAREGRSTGDDGIAQVLDKLVQRLVFSRVSAAPAPSDAAAAASGSATKLRPEDFRFHDMWCAWVRESFESGGHCTRQLERLCKQLVSTVQLLGSLLQAIGARFVSYVTCCLHLVLEGYLVACKHMLKEPLDALSHHCRCDDDSDDDKDAYQRRVTAFVAGVNRTLSSSSVSSTLAQLRRSSLVVVAQMFEQFPEDCMAAMETSPRLLYCIGDKETTADSLIGKYLSSLLRNSRGSTQDATGPATKTVAASARSGATSSAAAAAAAVARKASRSYVTPVLRLLTAWSQSTALLPLFPLFPDVAVGTFAEVFAVSGGSERGGGGSSVHRASLVALHQGLACLNELLTMRDESFPAKYLAPGRGAASASKGKSKSGEMVTFGETFLSPNVLPIFTSIYSLVVSGAEEESGGGDAAATSATQQRKKQRADSGASGRGRFSIMSFRVSTWKEIMHTTSHLSTYLTEISQQQQQQKRGAKDEDVAAMGNMLSRLAEVALRVVTHPACVADSNTAMAALDVVEKLLREVPRADFSMERHFRPLISLTNVITPPQSRLRLLGTVKHVLAHKATVVDPIGRYRIAATTTAEASTAAFQAQLEAAGRAVCCLNSFEDDNENLTRYDFELRYHAFHSLTHFFNNKGNYGAMVAAGRSARGQQQQQQQQQQQRGTARARSADREEEQDDEENKRADGSEKTKTVGNVGVRKERKYEGEHDVQIPLDRELAPVLCVEGFLSIATTVTFLLRDPESTIRALAIQLMTAMLRYATSVDGEQQLGPYAQLVLDDVIRRVLLPSLRRGVVARDVNIRADHMVVFGALGRHYASAFPSFAALYSPNTEQNFFQNVGHVQPRCRLHALAILRREAAKINVRDLLRVFVPFLMSAVKDFAQGKRDLRNLTESKAKGYCDAVLMTIAAVSAKLPWDAYHRILTLFLVNAASNASLRMPMLRGVVQVLNNFTFLDEDVDAATRADGNEEKEEAAQKKKKPSSGDGADDDDEDDDDEDAGEGEEDEEEARVNAEVAARRRQFRNQRIMTVLEQDILPQLFDFIGDGEKSKKSLGIATTGGEFKGNQHSVTAIRQAQQKEDKAASNTKNAILQLPVAIAITKIVKKFPEERFNFYTDHILDAVIAKLRTKNDKHRESARRILGALLKETGPSKLRFVVTKLKDNLVHGYQLHVLGYTIVTLLYQLYEPQYALTLDGNNHGSSGSRGGAKKSADGTGDEDDLSASMDPVRAALEEAKRLHRERKQRGKKTGGSDEDDDGDDDVDADSGERARKKPRRGAAAHDPNDTRTAAERREDDEVEAAEEELLAQLMPFYDATKSGFSYAEGMTYLMEIMDDLMRIFLDDYLGEVGMQKEQVELMSTIVEVKRNRSLQGFSFIARHCEASRVMEVFLQRITWVLTPPSNAASLDTSQLHGSERARALLMQEMKNKYLTVSKNAGADLVFVEKVRLLATRIARGLMTNPSMHIDAAFAQVRDLLNKHNAVREAKIKAFEARDGTRRIRGNAHMVIHKAQHDSWKEQLDKNFLVEPVPERVDVDFSSHTVLATQQKQKLRVYKGRYGAVVQEAARDFYREDPTTAVVLDTLDEFLMRFLLSVLKRVLGIGKEQKYTAAAVQLDLLRRQKARKNAARDSDEDEDGDDEDSDDEERDAPGSDAEEGDENSDELSVQQLDEDGEDDLDAFADAQQEDEEAGKAAASTAHKRNRRNKSNGTKTAGSDGEENDDEDYAQDVNEDDDGEEQQHAPGPLMRRNKKAKLSISFTTEYRALLESLVPAVLTTLQGEGSDPVIANALDCLLALVSLRPPLSTVHDLNASLFNTVTGFFGRGGSIKQRAMRVCAAVVAHQPFNLSTDQAAQLMRLVRAEVMDRSQFMPMALSLFYAVVGKHSHIVEIYDMIDVITELMVHLSTKPVIVRKCVMIFVRFLTEFKLTADKFRSHVDQLCKNLDFPELSGRLALLECLDTLVSRLPVVVLRQEAPVLLVPLAVTITSCEWRQGRERAGRVLQNIARFAGIDVLVPILSGWLSGERTSRPQRTMAAQVWATILPALSKAYDLPDAAAAQRTGKEAHSTGDATDDDRAAYQASCEWSVSGVLSGCLYDQFKAAGVKIHQQQKTATASGDALLSCSLGGVSKKDRETAEMKGWSLVFYSLRCAEAMLVALPDELYPVLGPRLLPALVDRLVTHTHPWVQSVALRILRHYCYVYVEQRAAYLQEAVAPSLLHAAAVAEGEDAGDDDDDDDATMMQQQQSSLPLPYILAPLRRDVRGADAATREKAVKVEWAPAAQRTFDGLSSLLKTLLSRVGASDVANEQQKANRTLEDDRSRTEALKIMVYTAKALSHVATSLLFATRAAAGFQKQVKLHITNGYASLLRHVHSLAKPMLEQRAVTNYIVRSATLVQFFGGLVSVLPQAVTPPAVEDGADAEEADAINAAVRWLLGRGINTLAFTQRTVGPLMACAFAAARLPQHRRLHEYAHQAASVVKQQLEDRRALLSGGGGGLDAADAVDEEPASATGKKRRRGGVDAAEAEEGRLRGRGAGAAASPTLDTVLTELTASLAQLREEKRERKIAAETRSNLKRNRREMEKKAGGGSSFAGRRDGGGSGDRRKKGKRMAPRK